MRVAATLDRINIYRARYAQAVEYMAWFLPAWQLLTDDDRFVLEAFFLGDGTQDEAVQRVCDHFYVERTSTYRRSPGRSPGWRLRCMAVCESFASLRQKVSRTADAFTVSGLQ